MPYINGSAINDGFTRRTMIFGTYVFIGYVIETMCFSADSFALSLQFHIVKMDGSYLHRWSSIDALVLKLLAWHLGALIPTSKRCTHLKGHGGLKQTVRQVYDALGQYAFVCKTDVKGYYESIDHALLLQQLSPFLPDKQVWRLIYHYTGWWNAARWQLRKAVAQLNQQLSLLKLTKALDKTFIGSTERGFSF